MEIPKSKYNVQVGDLVSWSSTVGIIFGIVTEIREQKGSTLYFVLWDDLDVYSFYVNDEIDLIYSYQQNLLRSVGL